MLAVKAIQDGGILRSANTTKILGISAVIPLILIGVMPILTGGHGTGAFLPACRRSLTNASGNVVDGSWDRAGWTLIAGGMFLAAWSHVRF